MPVFAVIGAAIGIETIGVALGGELLGSVVGGAIGGGLGGGVGSVVQGGSFSDGFKSGALGGALGAGFNAMGGFNGIFGSGATDAGMLAEQYAGFAPGDAAAHMAGSGLSGNMMQSVLEAGGMDAFSAADLVNNNLQSYGQGSTGFSTYSLPEAINIGSPTDISGGLDSLYDPEVYNALGVESSNIEAGYGPKSLQSYWGEPGLSTDLAGSGEALEGAPVEPGAPWKAAPEYNPTDINDLSGIYDSGTMEGVGTQQTPVTTNAPQQVLTKPEPTLFEKIKAATTKGMGGLGKIDNMQLGMAGLQTLQDYANAGKLQKLADQAAVPYNKYMETFNNPDAYWNEYMQGKGAEMYNRSARQMANSGRTGALPSLWTQAHQNYTSNYLPTVRQGLAAGGQMASANMQQQSYPMQMRTRALSHIPNVYTTNRLLDIYRRKT